MRTVICHYHIYKNSGTTFDGILARNFGQKHICFDGPFPYFTINQKELSKVILRNRSVVAFSSHQIVLPVPPSLEFNVLAAVFVRHPILRIRSIYKFKGQEQDGTETSRLAGELDFEAWCAHGLGHQQELVHVSNAQTKLLGGSVGEPSLAKRGPKCMIYDLEQAKRNLGSVALLARTECFSEDVERFVDVMAEHGIEFAIGDTSPRNVTTESIGMSLEERLGEVEAELTPTTWDALRAANQQDLALYDWVCAKLDGSNRTRPSSASSL